MLLNNFHFLSADDLTISVSCVSILQKHKIKISAADKF